MKENFTSINIVIDASGSMARLQHATIGSFNNFLDEQKLVPGEAVVTLCQFNNDYCLVHDFVKLANASALNEETYAPCGGTALLDALGQTINSVGNKLALLPEEERPSKVIFLVITDGHDNASNLFSKAQIKEMIEHQKEKYNWEFVFLGANIDAIAAGTSLGIDRRNTIGYVPSSAGTQQLYSTISSSMRSYRSSNAPRAAFFHPEPLVDANGNPMPVVTVSPIKVK